jgi:hypothetical protein
MATRDRTADSAQCRTGNKIDDIYSSIDKCATQDEIGQNNSIGTVALKLDNDITLLKADINNSLLLGDTMYGNSGHIDITSELQSRNTELNEKKNTLVKNINTHQKLIDRSERDFIDVKNTVPEHQAKYSLHVIEDYTVAFLLISYLFMISIFVYSYTVTSVSIAKGLSESLLASFVISMMVFLIFYYAV